MANTYQETTASEISEGMRQGMRSPPICRIPKLGQAVNFPPLVMRCAEIVQDQIFLEWYRNIRIRGNGVLHRQRSRSST